MRRPERTLANVERRRELIFLGAACLVFGMIPLVWPADAPWINDEPVLLAQAWDAVHQGAIPTHGLGNGSLGLSYGPVPIWLYSVALLFTSNLTAVILFRVLFFMLAIGAAV